MAVSVRDDLAWLRETVVPRILAACPEAERIWLFGSRARGDHHDGSDWDLMVVVPEDVADAVRIADATVNTPARGDGAVQVHVMSHSDFHDRLHLRASFPSAIVREGIILYEEVAMSAVDAAMWSERAEGDLRAMETLLAVDTPQMTVVLFVAQQAVEKAAKAVLARRDIPFPKTHELDALGELIRPTDPELADRTAALAGFGVKAMKFRYPSRDRVPDAGDVAADLEAVRRLVGDLLARAAA